MKQIWTKWIERNTKQNERACQEKIRRLKFDLLHKNDLLCATWPKSIQTHMVEVQSDTWFEKYRKMIKTWQTTLPVVQSKNSTLQHQNGTLFDLTWQHSFLGSVYFCWNPDDTAASRSIKVGQERTLTAMALFHATSEAAAFSIDREGQFRPGYHGHLTKNGSFFLLCRHHIILDFWCYVLKCLLDLWHHFSFPRFAPSRFCRGGYLLFEISWWCLPEVQERSWKSRDSHRVQRAAWPMPWSWEARHTQQGGRATQRLRLCEDRWLGRVFVCNLKSIF